MGFIPNSLISKDMTQANYLFQPQFPCLENEDNNNTYFHFRIGTSSKWNNAYYALGTMPGT